MGNLSGESREQNRKDKVTRFRCVTYVRQLGLLVNTLGSNLKANKLTLNLTKTNSMIFLLRQKKINVYVPLFMENTIIKQVLDTKLFGSYYY